MRAHQILFIVLALNSPAFAVDGVLEINQTCAVETGCFPGDTPGFPVTIGSTASVAGAGSFRLTSNLTTTDTNTDGIYISSFRVAIDFNGFSLRSASGSNGTGHGVTGSSGGFGGTYATIKNGYIKNFFGKAVELSGAKAVRIENMTIEFNRGGGIYVGNEARVLGNGLTTNGGSTLRGLSVGASSIVSNNVISSSGSGGIYTGTASTVSGNNVYSSGGRGIETGAYSTISGNTVYQNDSQGIAAGTGSTISGNNSSDNNNTGILAFGDANLYGNTVSGNSGYGLSLTNGSGYRGNIMTSTNTSGTVSLGVDLGGNLCGSSTTCP